ncbi:MULTISPECIES: CoA transferase subunit A [Roseomonadaceae]|uniref:CoA synthetase n=1 Tax=Falsiroseomonas oleicola TaxID=2801474 RepID=A0ABS6H4Y3_9PROT|nr:CoA-transferase [Roseomonas oleicola]MBU8543752.1 CoA synthetase [Roseomonas oleicola]
MTPNSPDSLAATVPDGALLALPPDNSLPSVALARALVRRGAKRLRLLGVPVSGFATDLLIGAGCVAEIQTSAASLGEAGFAPRFSAALKAGSITLRDATCPAIHSMLQAAEKGIPFMALRGIIGSDILANRPDWKVVPNPMGDGVSDPIVLLPALSPDVALIHGVMADEAGNIWVGRRRELATVAHASKRVLATVERMVKGDMLEDEKLAPGCISGTYIEAVAVAERGAWPVALLDEYGFDAAHVAEYARMAKTEAGFAEYLDRYVLTQQAQAAE